MSTRTEYSALMAIRSEVCNATLLWLAWIFVPALAISLSRVFESGWLPVMGIQVVLGMLIGLIAYCRSRLPYVVRAGTIIAVMFLIGIGAYFTQGGASGLVFFISASVMIAVFWGERAGVASTAFSVAFIGVVYFAFSHGMVQIPRVSLFGLIATNAAGAIFASIGPLIAVNRFRMYLDQDRARAEQTRQVVEARNAQLVGLNQELESFGYTISHDLRAPLRAISGYSQMLDEDYGPQLNGEARRLLATVQSEAERMGALIDDLLEFARLGRLEINAVAVDMNSLVHKVVDEERRQPGVSETLQVDIGILPAAFGDPLLLRQVWQNLIANAIKYSSKHQTPEIAITGECTAGEAVFIVADNGVGFDMKYSANLFGVFQRLHRAEDFPGTGVGLAIVHRVVSRHGGRVWANAQPGLGASFSFALPLVPTNE